MSFSSYTSSNYIMSDNEIGFGSQGEVALEEINGAKYAVKKIWEKSVYEQERDVLLKLQHIPGIIKLIKYDDHSQRLFLELGYKDCWNYIRDPLRGQSSIDQISDLMIQLITVVIEMHKSKIVHRDINPSNIIIILESEHNPQLRLCDFGFAVPTNSEVEVNGTDGYLAPEIKDEKIAIVKEEHDAYSVARLWWWLLENVSCFDSIDCHKKKIKALIKHRNLEASLRELKELTTMKE